MALKYATFDGKKYKLAGVVTTKSLLQTTVRALRERGESVRTVNLKGKLGYAVYVRMG